MAKEQQLSKDTLLEEIPIDDLDVGINIMMSVLGMKPERRILGLGDADVARVDIEQNMQNKPKVVEQQFNSTLQSWHHSTHQLCDKVPGFIVPPFMPLSIENNGNEKDDAIEDKENNFGENQRMSNSRE
ncbi:Hypothetical predicted protein [Olea europaea subsp. europaea]|uniref:Uncharacterized protein n=1 Tax=Olea europaea subsp. europaea TaxID=158383 RepID=A0A8S0UI72_OLEEU|nr:Hypothetical predicted protein [Olea europaea subsp. europaea]